MRDGAFRTHVVSAGRCAIRWKSTDFAGAPIALRLGMLSTRVRNGAVLSVIGHAMLAAVVVGLFAHPKLFEVTSDPVMVDIVSPKDVPQFDVPQFDLPQSGKPQPDKPQPQGQGPEVAKPAPTATQPAPTAAQSAQSAPQPAPKPEPPGQATFTPAPPAMSPSVFAPTQIPALLDLVTPATSAGLAPLAEVPADLAADDISAFKAHLRKCWSPPAGLAADPKFKMVLRVFLARNGSLSAQPVLMSATASPAGPALVQTATAALRRCAPFNFLPADRYKEWKVLDLNLSAADMAGG